MKRNQFTFYRSFWDCIQQLPTNKEKLQVFEIICQYALDEQEPDLASRKPSAAVTFSVIRPILERAHRRAEKMATGNNVSQIP